MDKQVKTKHKSIENKLKKNQTQKEAFQFNARSNALAPTHMTLADSALHIDLSNEIYRQRLIKPMLPRLTRARLSEHRSA